MIFLLLFLISLFCVVVAAQLVVKFSTHLSLNLKLSPLVIGATLIAVGTSLPELSVAVTSITKGVGSLSLGDIIGSNIVNIGFILGLSILIFPLRIGTEKTQRSSVLLVLVTLIYLIIQILPRSVGWVTSPLLIIFSLLFIFLEVLWGQRGSLKEDLLLFLDLNKREGPVSRNLLGLTVALLFLILSSRFLVNSSIELAAYLKLEK